MLERLPITATTDEFAQGCDLFLAQRPLEIEIELEPRHLEDVREEEFDLKPGRVHAFAGEKFGAALNDFQNRHAGRLEMGREVQRRKFPGGSRKGSFSMQK
jgi:hypothetical protein